MSANFDFRIIYVQIVEATDISVSGDSLTHVYTTGRTRPGNREIRRCIEASSNIRFCRASQIFATAKPFISKSTIEHLSDVAIDAFDVTCAQITCYVSSIPRLTYRS